MQTLAFEKLDRTALRLRDAFRRRALWLWGDWARAETERIQSHAAGLISRALHRHHLDVLRPRLRAERRASAVVRGFTHIWMKTHKSALDIQRVFRGYLYGRKLLWQLRREKAAVLMIEQVRLHVLRVRGTL
jgi:hypothetical protein